MTFLPDQISIKHPEITACQELDTATLSYHTEPLSVAIQVYLIKQRKETDREGEELSTSLFMLKVPHVWI